MIHDLPWPQIRRMCGEVSVCHGQSMAASLGHVLIELSLFWKFTWRLEDIYLFFELNGAHWVWGKFDPNRFFYFFCRGGPSLRLWPVGLKSSPVILWILTKKFQTLIAEKATNSNLDAGGWHRGARSMVEIFIPLCGPTIFKCLWFLFCKEVPWACFKIGNIQVCNHAKSIFPLFWQAPSELRWMTFYVYLDTIWSPFDGIPGGTGLKKGLCTSLLLWTYAMLININANCEFVKICKQYTCDLFAAFFSYNRW